MRKVETDERIEGAAADPVIRVRPFLHNRAKANVYRDEEFKGVLAVTNSKWYVSLPDPRNRLHVMPPSRWFASMRAALIFMCRPDRAEDLGHAVRDVTDFVMQRMAEPHTTFDDAVAAALDSIMEEG